MAHAATLPSVTITPHDPASHAIATGDLHMARTVDFEAFAPGERTGPLITAGGTFTSLGGTGRGGAVRNTPGNTGTGLYLRDRPVFGRVNTTPGGAAFLDSNDTFGMVWDIAGLGAFDRLFFTLSDVGDTGGDLTIGVDGNDIATISRGRRGGRIDMVMVAFDTPADVARLTLTKSRLNDGFAIDGAMVGRSPAMVPLPPALALLGAGLAGLVAARRRRAPHDAA